MFDSVIPVKTGIQTKIFNLKKVIIDWIPASAGMTMNIYYEKNTVNTGRV
jgi:hypothetical protein